MFTFTCPQHLQFPNSNQSCVCLSLCLVYRERDGAAASVTDVVLCGVSEEPWGSLPRWGALDGVDGGWLLSPLLHGHGYHPAPGPRPHHGHHPAPVESSTCCLKTLSVSRPLSETFPRWMAGVCTCTQTGLIITRLSARQHGLWLVHRLDGCTYF